MSAQFKLEIVFHDVATEKERMIVSGEQLIFSSHDYMAADKKAILISRMPWVDYVSIFLVSRELMGAKKNGREVELS